MSVLAIVATALCVGWAGLWLLLERQARRQRELEARIRDLERSADEPRMSHG